MKTFSKNIGMKIRENKCAYWNIKQEIVIESTIAIEINPFMNLRFTEWPGHKYFGIDINITENGILDKFKVSKNFKIESKISGRSNYSIDNNFYSYLHEFTL